MNVICVDKNQYSLKSLTRQTQTLMPDAAVFGCRSPEEALALAERDGCDILLTEIDLGRSDCDGLKLGRRIRELAPRARIVFVTEKTDPRYPIEAFRIPADGFMLKPVFESRLREELNHLRCAAV